MKRSHGILSVIVLLVILIAGSVFFVWISAPNVQEYEWTFQRALAAFDVPAPTTISNVVDNSQAGQIFNLDVTFSPTPDTVQTFVSGICDGILVQGYDPFVAIASAFPDSPNAILISDEAIHYSYSPDVGPTIFGNQCRPKGASVLQIRVDKADPVLYTIKLGSLPWGGPSFSQFPIAHFELPIDGEDFPLIVVGLYRRQSDLVLIHDRLCMESRTDNGFRGLGYKPPVSFETRPYIGADVRIAIDGRESYAVTINDSGKMVAYSDQDDYREWEWNFCPQVPTSPGRHRVEMIVVTRESVVSEYAWEYIVE